VASEQVRRWKEAANKTGRLGELDLATREYDKARAERINLEGKAATLNFLAYEAFCRVGTKLMSYSGARSTARDLQRKLRERGIEYDISAGELAEFKVLADRYLFRKKTDKDTAKAQGPTEQPMQGSFPPHESGGRA